MDNPHLLILDIVHSITARSHYLPFSQALHLHNKVSLVISVERHHPVDHSFLLFSLQLFRLSYVLFSAFYNLSAGIRQQRARNLQIKANFLAADKP
jgi:hypothetical protein